jgi:hypothetical protein
MPIHHPPLYECARIARETQLDPADPAQLDRIAAIYCRRRDPRSRARGLLLVRREGWHRWHECAISGIPGPRWVSGRPTRASREWAQWLRGLVGAHVLTQMKLLEIEARNG